MNAQWTIFKVSGSLWNMNRNVVGQCTKTIYTKKMKLQFFKTNS